MMRRDSPNWSPDVSDEQVLSKIEDLELLSPIPSPFAQMRGYTLMSPLSSVDLSGKRNTTSLSERDIQNSKIIKQVRKFNQHPNVSDDSSESLLPAERIRSQSSLSSVLLSPRIQPGSLSSIFASPRRQTLRPLSGRSSTESSFDELDTTFSPDILSGRSSGIQTNDPEIGSSSDLYSEETEVAVVPEEDLIDVGSSQPTEEDIAQKVRSVYLEACRKTRTIPCETVYSNLTQETISLKHRTLGSHSIKAVCIALVHNVHVTTIDLSNNNLGPEGASSVAQLLLENRNVVDLNLNENNITSQGLKYISKSLSRHKRMQRLLFSGNQLVDDVGRALARIVETNGNLKELHLNHNTIGDRTVVLLSSALKGNEALKVLNLGWNVINRKGAKFLSATLANNECLEELDVSWNGIGPEGCVHLGRMLGTNQGLRLLNLSNNRVNVAGLGHIIDGISQNETLQTIKLRNNPITSTGITWAVAQLMSSKNTTLALIDVGNMPVERPLIALLRSHRRGTTLRLIHGVIVRPCSDLVGEGLEDHDVQEDVMDRMFNFMRKRNLRVIDLFNTFGRNGRWHITKQDIRTAFRNHMQLEVATEEVVDLLKRLDMDKDGKVSLQDLIAAQRFHNRRLAIRSQELKRKNKDAVINIRKSMPKW